MHLLRISPCCSESALRTIWLLANKMKVMSLVSSSLHANKTDIFICCSEKMGGSALKRQYIYLFSGFCTPSLLGVMTSNKERNVHMYKYTYTPMGMFVICKLLFNI